MNITKLTGVSVIGGLFSLSSCKRVPYQLAEKKTVPNELTKKLDSISKETKKILKDKTYHFYGNDTLEITKDLTKSPGKYIEKLDKKAVKNTPKIKTGTHIEVQMIPRRNGGFDQIPVVKPTKEPEFINQKTVISSTEIYTRNGKDFFVPVEYYGQRNPKTIEKN